MALLTRSQVRLLLPLGTALALSLTGDSTLYAVLPNQTETVGISLGAVGVMLGANRLIRIPGNLLAGSLNDRLGRRRLFLVGLSLGILSTLSYSLVSGFWPLLAARLLWGISWALINVGGYAIVLDWSRDGGRGRLVGFYQVSYMAGLAISPILGGMLTDALGFRSATRICAGVSAVGLGVACIALPEIPPPVTRRSDRRPGLNALVGRLRGIDRHILLAAYVYLVVFFVGSGVLMSTIGLHLGQRWGTDIALGGALIGVSSLTGMMLAVRALLGIFGGPVAGILSDRLGNRWPVAQVGILLGVIGFAALALAESVWVLVVGVALVSVSAGALIAVLAAIVGDQAAGRRSGIAMGGVATAGDIGSAAGPLFAYALTSTWDLRWIYGVCGIALISCLLAVRCTTTKP